MRSFRLALALRTATGVLALTLLLGVVSAFALRTLLYRQLDDTLVHLAEVEAQAGAAHTSSEFEFHEGVLLAASPGPSAELTRYALRGRAGADIMLYGAILVLVISFLPQGIVGLVRERRAPAGQR